MQHDRSTLPVLLTFLKLPKLLSFHSLRLAAWEEEKEKKSQKRQQDKREEIIHRIMIVAFIVGGLAKCWILKEHMEVMGFTICLANGCISFLVHALLSTRLLPVCHRGGGAYVFGGGGAGHTLDCRVLQRDHTKTYQITFIWYKTCMFFKRWRSFTHQHFERDLIV